MQKITLLVTSFNSLSQTVYVWLKDRGYKVDVVYINSITRDNEIEEFKPDIILCPFLKHYIPSSIYENYLTFVFHPGVRGDRGAYSIEWALINEEKSWGGVWLRAVKELDAGDIYAFGEFELEQKSKAYVYRVQEKKIALNSLEELLENIKSDKFLPQNQNPIHSKPEISIEWERDTTKEIVKKINILDSDPGVKDTILGLDVYLFGGWEEEKLGSNAEIEPKTIIAKRDGAICLKTIDSAVWISHLKEENGFKLPSTYVLKDKLKGIKEQRLPLIFPGKFVSQPLFATFDKSYKTFYEVSADIKDDIAYLDFNFLNGAFRAEQCIRLKYAIEYLREQVKCIVLMGGEQFFSNGINLNILEDSKKQGEDGWSNINAINELIESVLFASNVVTIAYVNKNAGAGGVFLATACDFVVASSDVVFNPHYKTIGLSGSEYHSYTLPKRVGNDMAKKLLNECLPISANFAKSIGLIDEIIDSKEALEEFAKSKIEEDFFDDFIWDKEDFLEENIEEIKQYKEQELKVMYNEFWDEDSPFHKLRHDFVYKVCPVTTPERLKYKDTK